MHLEFSNEGIDARQGDQEIHYTWDNVYKIKRDLLIIYFDHRELIWFPNAIGKKTGEAFDNNSSKYKSEEFLMEIETYSQEETIDFAKKNGRKAEAGSIVCLDGDLGVETVSAKWLLPWDCRSESITSPTFTIVQIYEEGKCRCITLMSIEFRILMRWMRLDMKIIFLLRGYLCGAVKFDCGIDTR